MFAPRIARWLRDSAVIDSLAREVPTDSLRALMRQALTAVAVIPALEAIECESAILEARYGSMPALRAEARAESLAWSDADRRTIDAKLPERGFINFSPCEDSLPQKRRVGDTDLGRPLGGRPRLRPKPRSP